MIAYEVKAFFVLSVCQVIESKDCSAKEVSFFSLMEGMVKLKWKEMARYLVPSTHLTVISSNTRLVIVLYAKHTQIPSRKLIQCYGNMRGHLYWNLRVKVPSFFKPVIKYVFVILSTYSWIYRTTEITPCYYYVKVILICKKYINYPLDCVGRI